MFRGENSSSFLLAAGILVLSWVFLRRAYRRKTGDRPGWISAEKVDGTKATMNEVLGVRTHEVSRLQVEFHETARDLKAELDTKMCVLQQLTAAATNQAERLEAAIAKAERLGVSACADTLEEIKRVTAGPLSQDQLDGAVPLPAGALPDVEEDTSRRNVNDGRIRDRVYALADAGHDPATIAERVDLSVGDIDMFLSLRVTSPHDGSF